MSYENRALKAKCQKCDRQVAWFWKGQGKPKSPQSWACKCGCRNYLVAPLFRWTDCGETPFIYPRAKLAGTERARCLGVVAGTWYRQKLAKLAKKLC